MGDCKIILFPDFYDITAKWIRCGEVSCEHRDACCHERLVTMRVRNNRGDYALEGHCLRRPDSRVVFSCIERKPSSVRVMSLGDVERKIYSRINYASLRR